MVAEYLPGLPPARFRSLLLRMLFLEPSHTAFFTQVPPYPAGNARTAACRCVVHRLAASNELKVSRALLELTMDCAAA